MQFYKSKSNQPDVFECIKVYVPKEIAHLIKSKARDLGVPMSRLCAIAIDNELDQAVPFNYPINLPSEVTDLQYTSEGTKLLKFLSTFPNGTGRDTLMLCRRDMGIADKKTFVATFKELLDAEMIEEIKPEKSVYYTNPNHRRVVLKHAKPYFSKKRSLKDLEEKNNGDSE